MIAGVLAIAEVLAIPLLFFYPANRIYFVAAEMYELRK